MAEDIPEWLKKKAAALNESAETDHVPEWLKKKAAIVNEPINKPEKIEEEVPNWLKEKAKQTSKEPDYETWLAKENEKAANKDIIDYIPGSKTIKGIGKGASSMTERHKIRAQTLAKILNDEEAEYMPLTSKEPEAGFNQEYIGHKIGEIGVGAIPYGTAVAGGIGLGGAAGTAIAPGVGTVLGGLGGGFAGGYSEAALETLADEYQRAKGLGLSHEAALKHAKKEAHIGGLGGGVGGLTGNIGAGQSFLKQAAKQIPLQSGIAGAGNIAQNIAGQEIEPERATFEGTPEALAMGAVSGAITTGLSKSTTEYVKPPEKFAGATGLPPPEGPAGPTSNKPPPRKGLPSKPKPSENVIEGEIVPFAEETKPPFPKPKEVAKTYDEILLSEKQQQLAENGQEFIKVSKAVMDNPTPENEAQLDILRNQRDNLNAEIDLIKNSALPEQLEHGISETIELYRGTMKDVNPTDTSKSHGNALFYSPDRSVAESFATNKGNLIKNKITFNSLLKTFTWGEAKEKLGLPRNATVKDMIKEARKQGYDGLSFHGAHGQEYIHIPQTGNKPKKKPVIIPPPEPPKFTKAPEPEKPSTLPAVKEEGEKGIVPKREEKLADVEELTPDNKKTYDKIFAEGEGLPKAERSMMVKATDWITKYWNEGSPIETAIFDWQTPIKRIGARGQGESHITLRESANVPYRLARFTTHMGGVLNGSMKYGTPYLDKKNLMIQLKPGSKGLLPALAPAYKSEELSKLFQLYSYARTVESRDLIAQGREKNINATEASEARKLGETHPEFKQVFQDIQNRKKALLDFREDSGMMARKDRPKWEFIDHIPLYRDMGSDGRPIAKGSIAGQKQDLHTLTGGKRQYLVNDPKGKPIYRTRSLKMAKQYQKDLGKGSTIDDVGPVTNDIAENLIRNEAYILSSGYRNIAAQQSIKKGIAAGVVKMVPKGRVANLRRDGKLVTSVFQKGVERFYEISDPAFYKALTDTQFNTAKDIQTWDKALKKIKVWDTANIMLEPAVVLTVASKDFLRTVKIGKDKLGMKGLITHTGKNLIASIKHHTGIEVDQRLIDIMAAGGDSTYFSPDEEKIVKELVDEARKNDGTLVLPGWYIRIPQAAKGGIRGTGKALEDANRLTIYDAAIKSGRSKAEAIFEANDLFDYAMKGGNPAIRKIGEWTRFFRSFLQGLHKLKREMGHNYGFNRTNRNIALVAFFSSLNALINAIPDDDDDTAANGYATQPDWKKNLYVMFDMYKYMGFGSTNLGKQNAKALGIESRWILSPKPWTEGFVASSIPERMVAKMAGEDDAFKQLSVLFLAQLNSNPLPPASKEIIQQMTNYDFFSGQPIIPRNKESLEPALQHGPKSTEFSKFLGEKTNFLSPARIDHAINTLGGKIGTYAAMAPDILNGNAETEKKWGQSYFVKNFLGTELAYDNKLKNELYETAHAAQVATNTVKEYEDRGEDAKAEEYRNEKAFLLDIHKDINEVNKGYKAQLRGFDNEIDEVKADKSLSGKEKAKQVDDLTRERNLMLLDFHRTMKEMKQEYKQAK